MDFETSEALFDIPVKQEEPPGLYSRQKKWFLRDEEGCRACFTHKGLIGKYGLKICRRCFREYAPEIGFRVYD
jgi:ribosomal protein S14